MKLYTGVMVLFCASGLELGLKVRIDGKFLTAYMSLLGRIGCLCLAVIAVNLYIRITPCKWPFWIIAEKVNDGALFSHLGCAVTGGVIITSPTCS